MWIYLGMYKIVGKKYLNWLKVEYRSFHNDRPPPIDTYALSDSVFTLAEQTLNMKCVATQGLSNPTKKFGLGLKAASLEPH